MQTKEKWYVVAWRGLVRLDFISNFFTWFMELLARVVEPLASMSAIYIIIVAGVPALNKEALYTLALALIIGSPELLIVGAFKIATREISHGNRKGWALIGACSALLVLTALTVGDLFIWHWHQDALNVLMGMRCLAGIAYSFTRGIVTDGSRVDPVNPQQVNQALAEFTRKLEEMSQVNQRAVAEVDQVNQRILTEVHRLTQLLQSTVNQVNQSTYETVNQALQDMQNQSELAFSAALERLEHSQKTRLQVMYERLEQVTVTLENSRELPAVNPASRRLLRPAVNPLVAHPVRSEQAPVNQSEPREGSPLGGDDNELPGDANKIATGRAFVVNYYQQYKELPQLSIIQSAALCGKTLASRARRQAADELGVKSE